MDRLLEFHRRFAPVLVLVVAVACAPTPAPPGADEAPFAGDDAADVFAAGYGSVADKYIEKILPSSLALEGMRGLASIDPELSVTRSGDLIVLASSDEKTADFPAPADNDGLGGVDRRRGRGRTQGVE